MEYDKVLEKVGGFGLYQKLLCYVLVFYTTFLCGLNFYTQVFIFERPPHRCFDKVLDKVQGKEMISWEEFQPWIPVEHTGYPSKCLKLDKLEGDLIFLNQTEAYYSALLTQNVENKISAELVTRTYVKNSSFKTCDEGWVYNNNLIFPTISSENNWVCENDWKPVMIQSIFWAGNSVGCFLWGYINDQFGRRPTILLSHLVYFLAGVATLFSQNMVYLAACRFLVGCAHHTISHLPYLLVIEFCDIKSRTYPLLMMSVSYSMASMIVPWVAMVLPTWQYLAVLAPAAVLPVLICFKYIPESPSWLLVVGKDEEALDCLALVAKVNKQQFRREEIRKDLINEKEREVNGTGSESLLDMFRTPNLRVNAVLVNIICMMGFLCYYGQVQNTSNLGDGNIYKSYFFGALVEIPCWTVPFLINKVGRRWPLLILFFLSGGSGLLFGTLPSEWDSIILGTALFGRMTVTAAYFICLQYASEIFPTAVRGQGVAMCEVLGGVAIFISPSIVYLDKISSVLPLLVLGICALTGAFATFWLPETSGYSLPQNLEAGQHFGEDQSVWDIPCCNKQIRYNIPRVEIRTQNEETDSETSG